MFFHGAVAFDLIILIMYIHYFVFFIAHYATLKTYVGILRPLAAVNLSDTGQSSGCKNCSWAASMQAGTPEKNLLCIGKVLSEL